MPPQECRGLLSMRFGKEEIIAAALISLRTFRPLHTVALKMFVWRHGATAGANLKPLMEDRGTPDPTFAVA